MFKKLKKIFVFINIFVLIFLQIIPSSVQAASVVNSFTSGKKIDSSSRDAMVTAMSAASRKQKGPIVSIAFDSEDFFKPGSMVTASATVSGFLTPNEDLYYTWYIKHEGCGLSDNWWDNEKVKKETGNKCDLDGDDIITPNDWKIAAARINVRGAFDRTLADYSKELSEKEEKESGTEADPPVKDDETNKNYGWRRNFDWDENENNLYTTNSEEAPACSILQPDTGLFYELSNTSSVFTNTCPDGYVPSCIKDFTATCDVLNPEWETANVDKLQWCQQLPAPYDTQTEMVNHGCATDLSGAFINKTTNNIYDYCAVSSYADVSSSSLSKDEKSEAIGLVFDCEIAKDENGSKEMELLNSQATITCKDGGIPICTKATENTGMFESSQVANGTLSEDECMSNESGRGCLLGIIFKKGVTDVDVCAKEALPNTGDNPTVTDTIHYPNDPLLPQDDPKDPLPSYLDKSKGTVFGFDEDLSTILSSLGIKLPDSVAKQDRIKCASLAKSLVNGINKTVTVEGVALEEGAYIVKPNSSLEITKAGCSFEKSKNGNSCKHLFPYFPKRNVTDGVIDGSKSFKLETDDMAGDGEFSIREKQFWWADPKSSSTNSKIGLPDEAVVIGKGVETFTWTYVRGDEIGVVVEGETGLATNHVDSSYRKMWAFSQGVCPALEEIDESDGSFYIEKKTEGIMTTNFDLDRCLKDNLEVPGSELFVMKSNLSFMPKEPINDPEGVDGDSLKIFASSQNVSDLENVYYTWTVEHSSDGENYPTEDTIWKPITQKLTEGGFISPADLEGLDKNELNLDLNLPESLISVKPDENVFFLRVRVEEKEKSGAGNRSTMGSAVIKIKQLKYKSNVFTVTVSADGKLNLGAEYDCGNRSDGLCEVTKNQILGIKIGGGTDLSHFSWKVNNNSMICTSDMSADCGNGNTNTFIFPILGRTGESVNVVARAVVKDSDAISITKRFVIVEPTIRLDYDKGAVLPKLMGYYLDIEGRREPDLSGHVFETTLAATENSDPEGSGINPGGEVTFNAVVTSAWTDASDFEWMIDGEIQKNNNGSSVTFPIEKMVGDSYSINVIAKNQLGKNTKSGDDEQRKKINILRKALRNYWNVSPEESIEEEDLFLDVQLNIVDQLSAAEATSGVSVSKKPKEQGIFASLVTNLPEQVMFLLRMSLTSFAFLFLMSLIFSLMPEAIFERKNKGCLKFKK